MNLLIVFATVQVAMAGKTLFPDLYMNADRGSTVNIDCMIMMTRRAVFLIDYMSEARAIEAFARYSRNSEEEARHCYRNTTGRVIYNHGLQPWARYKGMSIRSRLNTTDHDFPVKYANINTLTIPNFSRTDEGVYRCCTYNSFTNCASMHVFSFSVYANAVSVNDSI